MNRIFDAHCDTIYKVKNHNASILKNSFHLDIERMKAFDTYIQIFAAFIDKKGVDTPPMEHYLALVKRYREEIEKNKDKISAIESLADLKKIKAGGAYSVLSLEGGEALGGSLDAISMYYDLGVRLITLTWNYKNELADGITEERGGGLTEFGRNAVRIMEEMGILIDVSHLSVKGFYDVAEETKHPFAATHSCIKTLCGHRRNLDDEQIKVIINRNGFIGINFYPDFLKDKGVCDISDIIKHIEYVLKLGGENVVGLGSDFDGVGSLPQGICGVEDMPKLADIINTEFSEEIGEKILFRNLYRVFENALIRGEKFKNKQKEEKNLES